MSSFLFGTSTIIDYQLNRPDAIPYVEAIIEGSESGYCSVITEVELWTGVQNRRQELETSVLLSKFEPIPLNSSTARLAGELLRGKNKDEIKAHFGDALIAATAIEQQATVLTADSASQQVFGHRVDYLVYR